MGSNGNDKIRLRERARILVIKAVIQVEEETMNKTSKPIEDAILRRMAKWERINNLLPPELQTRKWNPRRQIYDYKCREVFKNVLKSYRQIKRNECDGALQHSKTMTKPVYDILKKREDLLNARTSTGTDKRLRIGISNRDTFRTRSANGQNQGHSSEGQSMCKAKEQAATFLSERTNESESNEKAPQFDSNGQQLGRNQICVRRRNMVGIGNARIHWTEKARLLLIKAVILVEEEIMQKTTKRTGRSTPAELRKWERISCLLPQLQGETQNGQTQAHSNYSGYKCKFTFSNILKAYRDLCRKGRKGPPHHLLTKPIQELMKKREHLCNARISVRARHCLKPRRSDKVSRSTHSVNDLEQLSPSSWSSMNTRHSQGHSSWRRSTGTAAKRATSFLPEDPDDWDSTREALNFDKNASEIDRSNADVNLSRERHNADSHLRGVSRSVSMSEGSEGCKKPASFAGDSAPKSLGKSDYPEDLGERSRPRVQTRAQTRTKIEDLLSSTRPPSDRSRDGSSARKGTTSMANVRYDEGLQQILEMSLRRLELEFSSLGSWVQNQAIPDGSKGFSEVTSWAFRSGKRRRLNVSQATEAFDDLIHHSLSRRIDLHIRTSFQKLRVRFAEELKFTCGEVAQELQDGIQIP